MTVSQKQLEANKKNALVGGVKTPDGKAIAKYNALKHGLLAKEKNQQRIEVLKVLGNVPSRDELDRLLRYEGAIERQFYKALNQLERLQRLRAGDNVPAPIQVDVDVNTGGTA
jgi:hypothetical protein